MIKKTQFVRKKNQNNHCKVYIWFLSSFKRKAKERTWLDAKSIMKYKTLQTLPFDSQMDQDINYPFGQECNLKYMRALFNPDYAKWFQPPLLSPEQTHVSDGNLCCHLIGRRSGAARKKTTTTTCAYGNGTVCQPYQSYRVGEGERQIQLGLFWVWDARQLKQERRRDRNSSSWGRSSSRPVWLREPAGGSGINWHPRGCMVLLI